MNKSDIKVGMKVVICGKTTPKADAAFSLEDWLGIADSMAGEVSGILDRYVEVYTATRGVARQPYNFMPEDLAPFDENELCFQETKFNIGGKK
jgi:hypothetical protein